MTYREVVYQILDLSKLLNDDITINEEHVLFLVDKVRAALLWQKYKTVKLEVPEANYQTLCLDLNVSSENICDEGYLVTTCLPKLMKIGNTTIYPKDFYKGINIVLIDREAMRYVGENPWTRNLIYGSIDPSGKLTLKSQNPQFKYLKKIRITGIFESPLEASEHQCGDCGDNPCEPMDRTFPLEESLAATLIDAVVKEVVGAAYRPADQQNTANDELSDLATFVRNNTKSNLQKQIEA